MLKNKHKILIAMVVFLSTLLVCLFLWRTVEEAATATLKDRLAGISEDLGVHLSFESLELGLGTATLRGVTIGEVHPVTCESIRVEAAINLADPQILNPEVVHLIRPSFSTSIDHVKSLLESPLGKQVLARLVAAPSDTAVQDAGAFRWPAPGRIRITDGTFSLHDRSGAARISIDGLTTTVTRHPRAVSFRLESLRLDEDEERLLEGRLRQSAKPGVYEFNVRRKSTALAMGWEVEGTTTPDFSLTELNINADAIPALFDSRLRHLIAQPEQTGINGKLTLATADKRTWDIKSDLRFERVHVQHKSLGRDPIGPIHFGVASEMTYAHTSRELLIANGRLGIPASNLVPDQSPLESKDLVAVAFTAAGKIPAHRHEPTTWRAKVRVPLTPCQSALEVIPNQLAPQLRGFKLAGQFAANFDLQLDTDHAASFSYKTFNPRFSCQVAEAPLAYTREHLMAPFTLARPGSRPEDTVEIPLVAGAPGFTSLAQLGRSVPLAIVSSEDAGFYAHHGVEWGAIEQALRRNLNEKRIAIGGSTITMQTVKNLFLTNERTFSRKFQELFLAWHLDQELPKSRILEIYLNIVEFGPDIFGVTKAAKHFFGKPPADLSVKEATYLASIMPAPVTRYRYFCLGKTSQNFDELINTLLRRMHSLGRITFEQYVDALNEPLIFSDASRLASSPCHGVKQLAQRATHADHPGE